MWDLEWSPQLMTPVIFTDLERSEAHPRSVWKSLRHRQFLLVLKVLDADNNWFQVKGHFHQESRMEGNVPEEIVEFCF